MFDKIYLYEWVNFARLRLILLFYLGVMTVKFRKPLSLLLASLMVIGSASFAASAAVADSEDIVGAYSNQSYLENYAEKAYNVQAL